MFSFLLLVVGFIILIKGADIFVDGSANLAKNLGVSTLIIGLTIVAAGTSAPELAVSLTADITGSNDLALSNIIGSNTFNLLGILGICGLIKPLVVKESIVRRDFPISIVSTAALFIGVVGIPFFISNRMIIPRGIGLLLVIAYIAYVCKLIMDSKSDPLDDPRDWNRPNRRNIMHIIGGLIMVIGGSSLVVDNAKSIAAALGVSETIIGFTIVAVGTSLPELVTSVMAVKKGQPELAVGNIVGSNIFNLLFILGVSAMVNPLSINLASAMDLLFLTLATFVVWIFSLAGMMISKNESLIMLGAYGITLSLTFAQ